jgi:hypothetical protein
MNPVPMKPIPTQLSLPGFGSAEDRESNGRINRLDPQDRAFHDWYRFVLAFPPHLVRKYLQEFGADEHGVVLDPFCGTGTTLVERFNQPAPSAQGSRVAGVPWGASP